jgi:hypothetical protein
MADDTTLITFACSVAGIWRGAAQRRTDGVNCRKRYATSVYWNAGWSPAHPAEISGFCGTALVAEAEATPVAGEAPRDQYFYLWTLTTLSRPSDYGANEKAPPVHGVLVQ